MYKFVRTELHNDRWIDRKIYIETEGDEGTHSSGSLSGGDDLRCQSSKNSSKVSLHELLSNHGISHGPMTSAMGRCCAL